MGRGFELLAELGRLQDEGNHDPAQIQAIISNNVKMIRGQIVNMDMQGDIHRFLVNAAQNARDQIVRMQFSWYQFEEIPRDIVGRTYRNLRHVDIRQNGEFMLCLQLIKR